MIDMSSPSALPNLDYAFLAEFARVEGDSLTSVGASFTRVEVATFPSTATIYVAGRVRAEEGGDPFGLRLRLGPDDRSSGVELETTLEPTKAINPYSGKVGMIFSAGVPLTFDHEGRYMAQIFLQDELVRSLYFSVHSVTSPES
ncbi:hypothetical protein GCM10022377_10380 [Zhihengliuella alba]|uniref:Uncharacterized protein n=2 Tax=Zhihengliuella alba TaxID=547018 RepID=A0ABP7D0X8_9MICC